MDILVIIMVVIAFGVGIGAFITEHRQKPDEDTKQETEN